MARARLFVAAWLPDAVLDAIEAIPRPHELGVRYTTRDQWHITLRFLGSCEVDEAVAAFSRIDASQVEVALGPAVARLGRSVVVVPVKGLDAVAFAARQVTAGVGEPPDPRPFNGHVTVARLRNRPACRVAGYHIEAEFTVNELHLVQSYLRPEGARYETVAVRPLRR